MDKISLRIEVTATHQQLLDHGFVQDSHGQYIMTTPTLDTLFRVIGRHLYTSGPLANREAQFLQMMIDKRNAGAEWEGWADLLNDNMEFDYRGLRFFTSTKDKLIREYNPDNIEYWNDTRKLAARIGHQYVGKYGRDLWKLDEIPQEEFDIFNTLLEQNLIRVQKIVH